MPKAIQSIIGTAGFKQNSIEPHLEHSQLIIQQSQPLQYDTIKRNDFSPKSSASDSGISSGTPSPASILSGSSTISGNNSTITTTNMALTPASLFAKEPHRQIELVKNAIGVIKHQQEQMPGIQHRSVIVESSKPKTITEPLSLKLNETQPETVSSSADDKSLITSSSILRNELMSAKIYPTHYKKHFGQRFNASTFNSLKAKQMDKLPESTNDGTRALSLVTNDNSKTTGSKPEKDKPINVVTAAAAAAAVTRSLMYVNGMTPLFSSGHFDMYAYASHALR